MRSEPRSPTTLLLLILATAHGASAASGIENAQIVPHTVSRSLAATVNELAEGPRVWVGYSVPVLSDDHQPCCYDWNGSRGKCRLDDTSMSFNDDNRSVGTGNRELRVLLRVGDRGIDRVRVFGGNCAVDAAGAKIHVLDHVDPAESVGLLAGLVREDKDKGNDLADEALAAVSLHAEPSAGRALFRFAAAESPAWLRAKAAFWLGESRGEEALPRLHEMARKDPSEEVREQAVFAISISDAPGSEAILIDLARRDPRPEMRTKALFWLSQEAGDRIAADTIREAVEDDPNVEVKEQAVFALSQLPSEHGIPLLIDIARSEDRHPSVRRAAVFWLGQSGDPRALAFFEEVLR